MIQQARIAVRRWLVLAVVLLASVLAQSTIAIAGGPAFTEAERAAASLHAPWPPEAAPDPSNRMSGNPRAIALGLTLFNDVRLSSNGQISCAICHDPDNAFIDGAATGHGLGPLERNTSTLVNLASNRWFGWGGESDSLWMQSLRPLMSAAEMNAGSLAPKVAREDRSLGSELSQLSGKLVAAQSDEEVLVNIAKALAAYQETLVTAPTGFDTFLSDLAANDTDAMSRYPEDAQRGLQIFLGKGRCGACHFGPSFSNREFAEVGIPYFTKGGVDRGRHAGIRSVKNSPFNLLGAYADIPEQGDASRVADKTRLVRQRPDSFGQFRVPGLRSVKDTAPYMHNGSLKTLRDVVMHYSEIDTERLHMRGSGLLRPLRLSEREVDDLIAFLKSL